jgi:hypothetical protein
MYGIIIRSVLRRFYMKITIKLIGLIALAVVIALGLTACSDPDNSPTTSATTPATFTSFDTAGTEYRLVISRSTRQSASMQSVSMIGTGMNTSSSPLTPAAGDTFTLTVTIKGSSPQTTTGIVVNVVGGTNFNLQPGYQGATIFTLIVSGTHITTITGTITTNTGTTITVPPGGLSPTDPTVGFVVLAPGSQGIAGDGQVDGLVNGRRYIIQVGNEFYGITGNGTVHFGIGTLADALNNAGVLQPGVVSIFNLENGTTYNVFKVFGTVAANNSRIGGDHDSDFNTYGRNAVINITGLSAVGNTMQITRGTGRETNDTTIIFFVGTEVTAENINQLLWDSEANDGHGGFEPVDVTFENVAFRISADIDIIGDNIHLRGARVIARDGDTFFSVTNLGLLNEITITRIASP